MSHWLIRIPLVVVFLQQGFDKWPISADTAESFGLTLLVWTFVVLGEIGAGFGLVAGGILYHFKNWIKEAGDIITRFSGIVITGIMTGVIWLGEPDSFLGCYSL
jgi:putative oxidoreductase